MTAGKGWTARDPEGDDFEPTRDPRRVERRMKDAPARQSIRGLDAPDAREWLLGFDFEPSANEVRDREGNARETWRHPEDGRYATIDGRGTIVMHDPFWGSGRRAVEIVFERDDERLPTCRRKPPEEHEDRWDDDPPEGREAPFGELFEAVWRP